MATDQLIVLNKDSDTVSVIDTETGETAATIETDFNPHEVVVAPDGEKAYVTCSLGDSLLVIDTDTWTVSERITHELFDFPHGLAIREDAGELWLASTFTSELFVIDLETDEIVDHFPTHQTYSHMVSLTPDESRAFVPNIGSDSVTVVDCEERSVDATVPVGGEPEGVVVHPDAGVLVANQEDDDLTVLDPDTYEQTAESMLGTTPIRAVNAPDGRHVFFPNREGDDVSVVDAQHVRDDETQPWEVARIPVGIWPGGTCFDPDGEYAYVANNKTNDVSVIDADAWTEVDRFDTEYHPDGIAYLAR